MKIPYSPFHDQERAGGNILGSYKLSTEEQRQVLQENERRGLLHLINERNNQPFNRADLKYLRNK